MQGLDITLVRSQVNLGFAGGCNLAAAMARGDYLVFVNDDSRLDPGCVDHLLRRAADQPDTGAVGSRIFAGDGSLQEAGGVIWSDGTTAHVGRDLPAADTTYLTPREVDYCSANGLLVPRWAWDAVGGFDEAYYPGYYEDADLCMKLRTEGLRTVYEPTATLVHLETQSSSVSFRRFLMDRNRQKFRRRWRDDALADQPPPRAPTGGRRSTGGWRPVGHCLLRTRRGRGRTRAERDGGRDARHRSGPTRRATSSTACDARGAPRSVPWRSRTPTSPTSTTSSGPAASASGGGPDCAGDSVGWAPGWRRPSRRRSRSGSGRGAETDDRGPGWRTGTALT